MACLWKTCLSAVIETNCKDNKKNNQNQIFNLMCSIRHSLCCDILMFWLLEAQTRFTNINIWLCGLYHLDWFYIIYNMSCWVDNTFLQTLDNFFSSCLFDYFGTMILLSWQNVMPVSPSESCLSFMIVLAVKAQTVVDSTCIYLLHSLADGQTPVHRKTCTCMHCSCMLHLTYNTGAYDTHKLLEGLLFTRIGVQFEQPT